MLQPHNMMKEIKNSLSKFNVWLMFIDGLLFIANFYITLMYTKIFIHKAINKYGII